jgi:RND family efflux transporter MFP subunit
MSVRGGVLSLILSAFGAIACARLQEAAKPAASPSNPAREVRTGEVVRSGSVGELAVPGVVQARRRAALSARTPASVMELPYQEGQWVRAGDVVVRLDDAANRASVAAAEAGLKAAQADLDRTRSLLAKGAATPRELEQMTAGASAAEAQLTAARDALSYSVLRAPFAGRVAARRANLGDVVSPGSPLVEIEGEGGLELKATVDSAVAAGLRPGAKLRAQIDGQAAPLDAAVSAIAPAGDPTTHRFELKADLPAAAGLRAGLFARLLVPGVAAEPVLLVPAAAVFERGGLTGVFVVADGKARLRWIAGGARAGERVEVRAGLEAGERVVLDPGDLADGASLRSASAAGRE